MELKTDMAAMVEAMTPPLFPQHWSAAELCAANPRYSFFWPLNTSYEHAVFLALWSSVIYYVLKPRYDKLVGDMDQIARVKGEAGITRPRSMIRDGRWLESPKYLKTLIVVPEQAEYAYHVAAREFPGIRESDCLIINRGDLLKRSKELVRDGYKRLIVVGAPEYEHFVVGEVMESVWTFGPHWQDDSISHRWMYLAHALNMYRKEDFLSAFGEPIHKAIRDPERQREVITDWRYTPDGAFKLSQRIAESCWVMPENDPCPRVPVIRRNSERTFDQSVYAITREIGISRCWVICESDAQARQLQYTLHADTHYCDVWPNGRPRELVARGFNDGSVRYMVSPASRVSSNPAYCACYVLFTSRQARMAFQPTLLPTQTEIVINS